MVTSEPAGARRSPEAFGIAVDEATDEGGCWVCTLRWSAWRLPDATASRPEAVVAEAGDALVLSFRWAEGTGECDVAVPAGVDAAAVTARFSAKKGILTLRGARSPT